MKGMKKRRLIPSFFHILFLFLFFIFSSIAFFFLCAATAMYEHTNRHAILSTAGSASNGLTNAACIKQNMLRNKVTAVNIAATVMILFTDSNFF